MVAVDVRELGEGFVRFPLCLLRPHEETRDGEERDDGEDLVRALVPGARDEHLGELRVERELRDHDPGRSHITLVV